MIFNTFKELIDYVPNCFICHKPMKLFMDAQVNTAYQKYSNNLYIPQPRYSSSYELIGLDIKNGSIFPRKNPLGKGKYEFSINVENNNIESNKDFLTSFIGNSFKILKSCHTCRIYIETSTPNTFKSMIIKSGIFPPLNFEFESVEYTGKNSYHFNMKNIHLGRSRTLLTSGEITINKVIETNGILLPFNKIKNKKHLVDKLKTLINFI